MTQGSQQSRVRQATLLLMAAAIVLGLSMGVRQVFGLFVAPMSDDLGIGRGDFSLVIAVQNLIWGAAAPFFGILADRYGTGRVVAFGGLCYFFGILIMASAESLLFLHFGGGLLVGLGVGAAGFPLVLAAVARAAPPEKQALWLGMASAGGSAGMFLLLPGSQVVMDGFGWVTALYVLAFLSLCMAPLAYWLRGRPMASGLAEQSLRGALSEAGGHSGYRLLNLGFFVCGFHIAFIGTHLPGYIVACNLEPEVGALALGIIGFFNIIGGLGAGWLGGRFPRKYLLSAIYLARAIVIALLMVGPKTEWAILLFSGAFGLLWLSTVPLTTGLVGQIFGMRYMATLAAIVMFSHQIGAFFGAWLGGVSYDLNQSYDLVWYISIALGLLAAVVHFPIADKPLRAPLRETA
ncbi:MAG: MFS transporter [Rhodospirillales bacterium]